MTKREGEAPASGLAYWLARLKGLWAALLPLWELYQAVSADSTITEDELQQIFQGLVFFVGVWLIPNLGYIRRLKNKLGEHVTPGEAGDDRVPLDLRPQEDQGPGHDEPYGRHEDRDRDGVPDHIELQANEIRNDRGSGIAARRLRDEDLEDLNRP